MMALTIAGLFTGCVTRGMMESAGKRLTNNLTVTEADMSVRIPRDCPFIENIYLGLIKYEKQRSATDMLSSSLHLSLNYSLKSLDYFATASERPRYKLEAEITGVNDIILKAGNIGYTPESKRGFDTIICQPTITFTLTENVKGTTEGVVVFQNTYTGKGEGQRRDAEQLAMRDAVRQFLNEITQAVSE